MNETLASALEKLNRETGVSLQVLRLSFGQTEDGFEWSCESLPSPRMGRPALCGWGATAEVAAEQWFDEWRRWQDPTIGEKEREAALLAELREGK